MLEGLAALVLALVPQGRREDALQDFKSERDQILIENGQRHLEYGLELRKKGLTIQAATQITLAVEASNGKNDGAAFVLRLLRQLEDAFWKRKIERPAPSRLEAYEKKARKLREQDLEARLGIVKAAERRGLDEQAYEELREVLNAIDEPLVFDERSRLVLPGGKLSGELAERVQKDAIEINGRPYARDAFLRRVPSVARIFEKTTPELRVRSTRDVAEAERLHAAASALLPILYADLGVTPERRPQIVVLHERKTYGAYLDIAGLSTHRGADGFADRMTGTAVLCSQGLGGEPMTEDVVLGLALHELTHLCQLSASPAAFPAWYMEGSAEKQGGEGAFLWDGQTLVTGGKMAPIRITELRAKPLPLKELFEADPLALLGSDRLAARRFYAQSWAFLRFLEQGTSPAIAERLDQWRRICLGSILGADLYRAYAMDSSASQKLFLDLFGPDLERLESEFVAWLAEL